MANNSTPNRNIPKKEPSQPRQNSSSKGSKKQEVHIMGIVGYGIFCLAALFIGTVLGLVFSSKTVQEVGLNYMLHPDPPQVKFNTNSMNVLVLGCDVDETTGGAKITKNGARSDTMLLVHFDFPNKTITGISIPRDILLKLPGMPIHKMNAFHEFGGDPLAAKAVEALLPGIHVDRTVAINFNGFINMVNAVGGVPYYVPKNMNWDDNAGHLHIHLKKGMQILDGKHAEELVRFRHSDSDIVRQERQHAFVLAFQEELKHNPQALASVLDQTVKMLADGFTPKETISLGAWVAKVKKQDIRLGMLPTRNDGRFALHVVKHEIQPTLMKYQFLNGNSETS